MGDFGSQGISLVHTDVNAQKFYQRWWEEINGSERSERFLNNLFRCGNVVIKRRHAKLTKTVKRELSKGDEDLILPKKVTSRTRIPFVYDFLNPVVVDIVGGNAALFSGEKQYFIKISKKLKEEFKKNNKALVNLPNDIKEALKSDKDEIPLDPETIEVFHYKKDDWETWASPMINAILDDITMMEKMKLADMSALDGAISNIRLWKIGDLEHKILPTSKVINKLRDILSGNVGGGTMDLVWGPELDFKESNSQVYKFLGSEKYEPVLNSIYAGLGIPPTLTGLAGQSGGFTNNFISLKTLIERLEYGRQMLEKFWNGEIRRVQKAMGFSSPAKIHFDHMILSDDSSEKNLLINLADRHVISSETLRERFGEDNDIENARIKREERSRTSHRTPPKAGPYHNAHIEDDYNKIALQKDQISIDQVSRVARNPQTPPVQEGGPGEQEKKLNKKDNGRPKNVKDTKPRKTKVVKPKTKPGNASLLIWAGTAQRQIAELLTPSLLASYGKKNLRTLSKKQHEELEVMKTIVLANIKPYSDITHDLLLDILESHNDNGGEIIAYSHRLVKEFLEKNSKNPSLEEMRQIYCLSYVSIKNTL
jgi:hypothetical protein